MLKSKLVIALVVSLSACREGPAPFSMEIAPFDTVGGTRLTFSSGRDRAPFWNKAGDSIFYSAEGSYPPLPNSRGVLVGVPARGGRLRVFMPQKQIGLVSPRFLAGGSVSPDGNTVAFFELIEAPPPPQECTYSCTINETEFTQPNIARGVLRISLTDGSADRDTSNVSIAGRFFDNGHSHYGLDGRWVLTAYPFHRLFLKNGAQPFRPSWSPDGSEIVYSDGIQLHIYNVQSKQTRALPGTTDGVFPSWSPSGDWIAYSRLLRSDSTVTECLCVTSRGGVAEEQRRVIFNQPVIGNSALMVIKPDGSQPRVLGPGDMPSWLPDGKRLVFRRGDQLWRASVDGTEAQPIPNTKDAEEPSVSPDGKFVAFVRGTMPRGVDDEKLLNFDVWVVPLRVQ